MARTGARVCCPKCHEFDLSESYGKKTTGGDETFISHDCQELDKFENKEIEIITTPWI